MLHHCRAVARGCKASFIVADLPYGSYEASPEDAVRVSLRFLKEGNVEVKIKNNNLHTRTRSNDSYYMHF